jgi:SAM-dependent methyltransferase
MEHWKPPVYSRGSGFLQKIKLMIFGFLDLQYRTIWKDLSVELPKVKGTALDIGCGIQPYRHLFPPEVRYIGVDSVYSKAHFGYEAPDTLYYSGKTWPVSNRTADFILCTETLEHVLDPLSFLREAFRCLKPGARLLLTVPFAARWHFIPHDYWRYTPSGLNSLLNKAGFNDIQIFARGNQFTVICYKLMGFAVSLIFPMSSNFLFEWICRLVGFLALPMFGVTALLANLTLDKTGSVDCLGFTAIAVRPLGRKSKGVR